MSNTIFTGTRVEFAKFIEELWDRELDTCDNFNFTLSIDGSGSDEFTETIASWVDYKVKYPEVYNRVVNEIGGFKHYGCSIVEDGRGGNWKLVDNDTYGEWLDEMLITSDEAKGIRDAGDSPVDILLQVLRDVYTSYEIPVVGRR